MIEIQLCKLPLFILNFEKWYFEFVGGDTTTSAVMFEIPDE